MSKETLKPCPFCNGTATPHYAVWAGTVECDNPKCSAEISADTLAEAIAAWNARAEGPAPPGGGGEEDHGSVGFCAEAQSPPPSDGPVLRAGGGE